MACVVAAVRREKHVPGLAVRWRSRTAQVLSLQAQHRELLFSPFTCESRPINLTLSSSCDHVVSERVSGHRPGNRRQ